MCRELYMSLQNNPACLIPAEPFRLQEQRPAQEVRSFLYALAICLNLIIAMKTQAILKDLQHSAVFLKACRL